MTTGTSAASLSAGGSPRQSLISRFLATLRQRLHPWRFRRWIRQRPDAVRYGSIDACRYLRIAAAGVRHVHVLRETHRPQNDDFFRWLHDKRPAAARLFRYSTPGAPLGARVGRAALLAPWLWDPVRERDARLYRRFRAVERRYEQAGVPIVNPVSRLSNAIKSNALAMLREAGFTAARSCTLSANCSFDALVAAVGLPFIVRNDHGSHGYVRLVRTREDFRRVDWSQLPHAVALEYLDTRSADGLYRKYRYLVTGDTGINRHLVIARDWCVHADDRLRRQAFVDEELAFVNAPNPFHQDLVRAARTLELDLVAFDYSVDRSGRLVIWEPNPYPGMWPKAYDDDRYYDYQRACVERVFAHMLSFYLRRASLE